MEVFLAIFSDPCILVQEALEAHMHTKWEEDEQVPWKAGTHFYRLEGKTPSKMRHELVERFNAPSSVAYAFIISMLAGERQGDQKGG